MSSLMSETTAMRKNILNRIDALPGNQLQQVIEFIDSLSDDDPPLTEDELAQIRASKEEIAAGNVYSLETFNRMLDALP